MTNASDYVSVGGNFLMKSSCDRINYLTNGTLEIKGNFTQRNGSSYNFMASGNHKVILYGTASFESTISKFNILVNKNTSGASNSKASGTSNASSTSSKKITGWMQASDTCYYYSNGKMQKDAWVIEDYGSVYYLNSDGEMATGWLRKGNEMDYFASTGQMLIQGLVDGGEWHFYDPSGEEISVDLGDSGRVEDDDTLENIIMCVIPGGGIEGIGKAIIKKEVKDLLKMEGKNIIKGVGNAVKIEGRGITGRIIPNSLEEQMAMEQVKSNPLSAAKELPLKLGDDRWPALEGWVKMQSVVKNSDGSQTVIHFLYNKVTGAFDDFKYK